MRKYLYIFKSEVMSNMQYIFDLTGGMIGYFLHIFIFVYLYRYLYSGGEDIINGYSLSQMIWYVIITELIWCVLGGRKLCYKISKDVKDGNIAYNINKPYSYIGYVFSGHLGDIFIKAIMFTIFGMLIGFFFIGGFPKLTLLSSIVVLISCVLAIFISIFLIMIIGLFSFYIEDSHPFYWLYSKVILVLGTLLPIEYFPTFVQGILKYLPSYVVAYGPAKLFVDFSSSDAIKILGAQIIYLIISYLLCAFIYKKGVRKLNVNGG